MKQFGPRAQPKAQAKDGTNLMSKSADQIVDRLMGWAYQDQFGGGRE